jgi:uncharacterized membrane protein
MSKIKFPIPFKHNHPPIRNVNELIKEKETFGQKASDLVARTVGSWRFIIIQSIVLLIWIILNVAAYINHWDPYPFILMNLFLSLQAAYTAPIIMMSQNKQAERDRIEARNDYNINQKAEEEVRAILDHLHAQNEALEQIHNLLMDASVAPKG